MINKIEKLLGPQCLSNLAPFKRAFTLAEVLITLGIIGVVAAMTIPTLITNNQQRSMDTAANVFNRKLGEALKVMNSQSSLAGFTTTRAFVDELSKHIKITKVCNSDKLDICFASEFSTNEDIFKVADLKQASNLNQSGNYGTETIGVVFADGVSALIAYNPNATQDPFSNQVIGVTSSGAGKDLQIGLGTDALAILYDVSGPGNPNTYGTDGGGKFKDIRGLNVSINVGADILDLGTTYSAVDCSSANSSSNDYTKYCGNSPSGLTSDYWAGAQKTCNDKGMKLPSKDEVNAIGITSSDSYSVSAWYWSSTDGNEDYAWNYTIYDGGVQPRGDGPKFTQYNVICIAK